MNETDVIIIGAGAAGLAAANKLHNHQIHYLVLEAKGRIGGRAYTDTKTFDGVPIDRGCHWLHSASRNLFLKKADQLGFVYDDQFSFMKDELYLGGEKVTGSDRSKYEREMEFAFDALHEFKITSEDLSVEDFLGNDLRFGKFVRYVLSLMSSNIAKNLSTKDFASYADTEENYPVRDGLGTLVCTGHDHLNIELSTQVKSVDWNDNLVRVETDKGDLNAKKVIITVSTGVLASDSIKFTPHLPDEKLEAIESFPVGNYEKVGFLLKNPVKTRVSYLVSDVSNFNESDTVPCSFVIDPFGRSLITAEIGGMNAKKLVDDSEGALVDFALSGLKDIFGTEFEKEIVSQFNTNWAYDAHTLGSYSYGRFGKNSSRKKLAEQLNEQLYFAGEATSLDSFSTVHGAHQSGEDAALSVMEQL